MKFRIIIESDEITVVTENGGIACIREADGDDRTAITDYYHSRLTEDGINYDNVFELLAEGNMECKDWKGPKFNDLDIIEDALDWLSPQETAWELVDNLFKDLL